MTRRRTSTEVGCDECEWRRMRGRWVVLDMGREEVGQQKGRQDDAIDSGTFSKRFLTRAGSSYPSAPSSSSGMTAFDFAPA